MQASMQREVQGQRPSRQDLLDLFRASASEVVEKDFHHVLESSVISDLAIDSLGMLEIIGALERELRIQIPDEMLAGVQTLRDLLDVVEERIA